MKRTKKILSLALCAVLLVAGTVATTVAYLTSTDAVTNTFTVGNVKITLDEFDYDEDSDSDDNVEVGDETRDKANAYYLQPGQTYKKDPTVTVKGGSAESYVRMIMTVHNASAVQDIINADDEGENLIEDYSDLFSGWDENKWEYTGCNQEPKDSDGNTIENAISFEFRYSEIISALEDGDDEGDEPDDVVLPDLFTEIIVPSYVDNELLAALYGADGTVGTADDFKIEVVAHAIQATGFENNVDGAWTAFDAQQAATN